MATKSESKNTITIDLEVLLIPLSIILSAIMISASIVYAFKDGTPTTTGNSGNPLAALGDYTSMESIVEEIEVNVDDFTACVEERDFASEIAKDTSDGSAAGISGTPGFIIGTLDGDTVKGELVSGAQPYAVFEAAIEKYINGESKSTAEVGIDDDPIRGDKNSVKVALVEFSDFECPFCQRYHTETYEQIISNYVDTGKIAYVYRDFPLSFHQPKASEAASAANCVRELAGDDKFFEFTKLYYASTKSNGEGL